MFIKSTLITNLKTNALNHKKQNYNSFDSFLKRSKYQIKPNKQTCVYLIGPSGGILGVGSSELIVIGIVAWLVLGPKRLYQLAKDLGRISGELKNVAEEAKKTFQVALDSDDSNIKKISDNKKTPKPLNEIKIDEIFDKELNDLNSNK